MKELLTTALYSREKDVDNATAVLHELIRARRKFLSPENSAHEGFAVLKEEVDELWDEVKGHSPNRLERMREEAIQVAAMAIRFITDVCDKPTR